MTGVPLTSGINNETADAKYQISFKERLTNAVLPFETYLFLSYTQKSFWNIYRESSPFSDTNYNPAIAIGKILLTKNKMLSIFTVAIEHESNGRDTIYSRSWNKVSFTYFFPIAKQQTIKIQGWILFAYKTNNADLMEYVGYGELVYTNQFNKLTLDLTFRKGANFDKKGSIMAQVYYKTSIKSNKFLTIQYYNGYAESLLNYTQKTNSVRIGFVFKPTKFGYY